MKKKQLNYHVGLKTTAFYKAVVLVVFFAIFANIVNFRSFYKGSLSDLNTGLLQSESGLSRIFYEVNLPVKAFNDLFKSQKMGNGEQAENAADNEKYAILTQPVKRFASELNKRNAYFTSGGMEILQIVPIDTGPEISLLNLSRCNNFIMTLLLILLLMSLLPRGVPSRIKNNIYIYTSRLYFL